MRREAAIRGGIVRAGEGLAEAGEELVQPQPEFIGVFGASDRFAGMAGAISAFGRHHPLNPLPVFRL